MTPASPLFEVAVDPREIGRVVATVLLAAGAPPPELVARANRGLARFGRQALHDRDLVVSSPEEVAPAIPEDLRPALAELLVDLAGEEPLRRRVALATLALWGIEPPVAPTELPAAKGVARVARWFVGALPRHQTPHVSDERPTPMQESVYRAADPELRVAPPVRDPLRLRVERISAEFARVVDAVERVVLGKRDVVERVLTAMAARGHVLLVDVPGVGKTQLCKAIAAAVGVRAGRIQFTPDLLPMDLTGANIYDAQARAFAFRPGPVFTQILLADEINRATPKTQSALLEVMEERTVSVDGTTHRIAEPFQVLATMNPLDHDGTFALPAAQIDRFMFMLEIGYPTAEDEVRVLDVHLRPDPALASVEPVLDVDAFLDWQRTVPLVHASPEIKRAAVDFVNGLRRDAAQTHSVSPRATLAWLRASQARAMVGGREFVTLADLLDVAPAVFRHRLAIGADEVRDRFGAVAARGRRVER